MNNRRTSGSLGPNSPRPKRASLILFCLIHLGFFGYLFFLWSQPLFTAELITTHAPPISLKGAVLLGILLALLFWANRKGLELLSMMLDGFPRSGTAGGGELEALAKLGPLKSRISHLAHSPANRDLILFILPTFLIFGASLFLSDTSILGWIKMPLASGLKLSFILRFGALTFCLSALYREVFLGIAVKRDVVHTFTQLMEPRNVAQEFHRATRFEESFAPFPSPFLFSAIHAVLFGMVTMLSFYSYGMDESRQVSLVLGLFLIYGVALLVSIAYVTFWMRLSEWNASSAISNLAVM